MEFKDLYIIDGIIYAYESNNGVYAKLVDILTGYEILINLENLYKNFEKSGNWYYKQISSNFYMLFGWFQNIPGGESFYDLPISTISEHMNSVVLATQTGAGAIKPITCYIKNRKLYFNSQNTTVENYSIFAIVQV